MATEKIRKNMRPFLQRRWKWLQQVRRGWWRFSWKLESAGGRVTEATSVFGFRSPRLRGSPVHRKHGVNCRSLRARVGLVSRTDRFGKRASTSAGTAAQTIQRPPNSYSFGASPKIQRDGVAIQGLANRDGLATVVRRACPYSRLPAAMVQRRLFVVKC